jgi:hypothetical protein
MQHLDGNVLAGPLADLFGFDATAASARCRGCGTLAMLATAMVWQAGAGTVVRCASCDSVLATIVDAGDRRWVSLSGIDAFEVPA